MNLRYQHESIQAAQKLIATASRIVLTSHRSPDGDAVGSGLAMMHYLLNKGKNVVFMVPDQYPEFLFWLPGHAQVVVFDQSRSLAEAYIQEADLIFSLDYNQLNRTGEMQSALEHASADFILIDHHHSPGNYPAVTFSDTSACSTCEMIYDFIVESGDEHLIDRTIGTCIYTGIMTDSGSFRFPSVKPHTHLIAANLIEKGVDHSFIHRQVYDNNMLNRLQLLGYALSSRLEMVGDHAAMIVLDKETLNKYNHQPGDTEGLVNYALSIKGVNVAVFVREGSNEIRLSFRSKGSFDVNVLAREYFEGGGHSNAAGGRSSESLDNTTNRLKEILLSRMNDLNY
jgi:phosphoesterase RecJ-like protein